MSQLGVVGLVDVNLGARLTQVPDNLNTRYAYIQGSIIEHALGGFSNRRPQAWLYTYREGKYRRVWLHKGTKNPPEVLFNNNNNY